MVKSIVVLFMKDKMLTNLKYLILKDKFLIVKVLKKSC